MPSSQSIPASGDRRKANKVFPPVYEALRPFFDRRTQWGGHSGQQVLAYRMLKDHFPELSAQDRFLAVVTAQHLFHWAQDAL